MNAKISVKLEKVRAAEDTLHLIRRINVVPY